MITLLVCFGCKLLWHYVFCSRNAPPISFRAAGRAARPGVAARRQKPPPAHGAGPPPGSLPEPQVGLDGQEEPGLAQGVGSAGESSV